MIYVAIAPGSAHRLLLPEAPEPEEGCLSHTSK
jgi:hypothetical protein